MCILKLFKRNNKIKTIKKNFVDLVEGRLPIDIFWEQYGKDEDVIRILTKTHNKFAPGLYDLPDEWLSMNIDYFFHRAQINAIVSSYLNVNKIKHTLKNEDVDYVNSLFGALPLEWLDWLPVDFMHNLYSKAPTDFNSEQKTEWFKGEILRLFQYKDVPPEWLQPAEWPIKDDVPYLFLYQEDEIGRSVYHFVAHDDSNDIVEVEQFE